MSWLSEFLNPIGSAISSVASPIMNTLGGAVKQLAPAAGGILGGMYGGPMGAMLGSSLGGSLGGMIPGQNQSQQLGQAAQVPMGQLPYYGGYQAGNYMANQIPGGYGDMNMQQAGGGLGQNLGRMGSDFISNRFSSYLPQQSFGEMGSRFGNWAGNQLEKYAPSFAQGYGRQIGHGIGSFINQGLGEYGGQSPSSMFRDFMRPEGQGGQYAQQFGRQMGERGGQMANQYLPRDMQDQTLGNMARYAGTRAGEYGSNLANRYMPPEFQEQPFSNIGQGAINYANRRYGAGAGESKRGQESARISPQGRPEFRLQPESPAPEYYARGGYARSQQRRDLNDIMNLAEDYMPAYG
jgi:hypothetical protein